MMPVCTTATLSHTSGGAPRISGRSWLAQPALAMPAWPENWYSARWLASAAAGPDTLRTAKPGPATARPAQS